jgi:hypothetical protein
MSRSYKKNPICTDGGAGGPKRSKRTANHKIRKVDFEELPLKGNAYRKFFCSYDIHDFICRWTWEDALDWWEKNEWVQEEYPTKKDLYRWWIKGHKRK